MELTLHFKSGIDGDSGKAAAQVTIVGFETEQQAEDYMRNLSIQLAGEKVGTVGQAYST